jgi:OOP family OmpA-OmpF porin
MKHLSTSLILSAGILLSSATLAQDDWYISDSFGNAVKSSNGNCLRSFVPSKLTLSDCDGAKVKAAENMASGGEEPVIKEVINLKGVTFKTGSDELTESSNARLDQSAQDLLDNPNIKVIVAGHTDNVGDPAFNLELSKKRAQAVRAYLIEKGVSADRMIARGYGDTEPNVPNDTAEGRAQNRRVELRKYE